MKNVQNHIKSSVDDERRYKSNYFNSIQFNSRHLPSFINILPIGTETKKMQSVNMEVKTAEGTIFPLRFTMKKNSAGQWKVVNIILNGVNVAKAYNSHFNESMIKHGNNIDELIANWNAKIDTNQTPPK